MRAHRERLSDMSREIKVFCAPWHARPLSRIYLYIGVHTAHRAASFKRIMLRTIYRLCGLANSSHARIGACKEESAPSGALSSFITPLFCFLSIRDEKWPTVLFIYGSRPNEIVENRILESQSLQVRVCEARADVRYGEHDDRYADEKGHDRRV